jgi:hypothetical protein
MKHKRRARLAVMKEHWARTLSKKNQAQDQLASDKAGVGKGEFIPLE